MAIVRLRLACHGQRNRPFFHIVAISNLKARDAKPLEKLGEYDPIPKPRPDEPGVVEKKITWDVDRVRYWLGVGAQPSETVARLLEQVIYSPHFAIPYDIYRFLEANLLPEGKLFKGTRAFREAKTGASLATGEA
ncbi:ribosomal protein S16 [Ceratobasidium sp. AG-Ba]|nr:ribosomal protein S16 [Ceratobasidium sp. AG-Ba]